MQKSDFYKYMVPPGSRIAAHCDQFQTDLLSCIQYRCFRSTGITGNCQNHFMEWLVPLTGVIYFATEEADFIAVSAITKSDCSRRASHKIRMLLPLVLRKPYSVPVHHWLNRQTQIFAFLLIYTSCICWRKPSAMDMAWRTSETSVPPEQYNYRAAPALCKSLAVLWKEPVLVAFTASSEQSAALLPLCRELNNQIMILFN